MNDITALMATMKAAAEKAKQAGEAPVMDFYTRIDALNEFQLAACPCNVLVLVEALEARQPHHNGMMQLSNELVMAKLRMVEQGLKRIQESRAVTASHSDYFASLVAMARVSADKAMRKFPQPNYVLLKVAEEAGEVVQAGVHYAEKRMEWQQVEGEIVQLLAMLIRLVTEGDQINGITPPAAGIQVVEGAQTE